MYLLSSIPHVTTLIAPPISAVFMRISIWLPFGVAIGSLISSYALVFAMPESLTFHKPITESIGSRPSTEDEDEDIRPLLASDSNDFVQTQLEDQDTKQQWWTEIVDLLRSPGLCFCFTLFLIAPLALIAKAFVYQHASETFGWEISRTTWLRVSQAAGASIVTLFTLPLLNALLHRRGFRAQKLDLGVLRASLFIAAIGFGLLWQATESWMLVLALFVCGLSEGMQPANQGLATSLITREYNARLFTTVAVLETVGKLAGGPIQSVLFSIGRRENHGSLGINFLTSSAIFILLLFLAIVVRIKR